MKILAVHNSYQQPGGEDRVFSQECNLLRRAGHQLISYERSNHEISGLSVLGKALVLPKTLWAADTRRDFLSVLRREKPDVVHVHNTFVVISPSIYSACREEGVPVVQTLHNFRLLCPAAELSREGQVCEECLTHGLFRGVRYGCYRGSRVATATIAATVAWHRGVGTWSERIDAYIALSEFARGKFVEGGLPASRISVKPNFVDPDPGEGTGPRSHALFVGRLSKVKGVYTLLQAWSHLENRIPLVIAGDGPERAGLEREAARLGLTGVTFRGFLSNAETIQAMQQARFLVFPSEWYENFPVTIAEAFACGTPVLCSRLGSMQEIVQEGRVGLHFEAGDARDLARMAACAWDHPEEMRMIGREARQVYERKYTAEANYPQLMAIYEEVTARRRPRSTRDGEKQNSNLGGQERHA